MNLSAWEEVGAWRGLFTGNESAFSVNELWPGDMGCAVITCPGKWREGTCIFLCCC